MKLAAIDIGSNAVRFQITSVLKYKDYYTFKKVEYIRFPLRLGEDVFRIGHISDVKQQQLIKLLTAYKLLIELYEIKYFLIYATSALRESANGVAVVQKVLEETGLEIQLISGMKEAEIINKVVIDKIGTGVWLHIDVGGGSTELTLYKDQIKFKSSSFPLGSVRRLDGIDHERDWKAMEKWVKQVLKDIKGPISAIGTGGNINKMAELASVKQNQALSFKKLQETILRINKTSMEDRVNVLMLNPDRADVIVPAAEIYSSVMRFAEADQIFIPQVGLKDGMIHLLFEKRKKEIEGLK